MSPAALLLLLGAATVLVTEPAPVDPSLATARKAVGKANARLAGELESFARARANVARGGRARGGRSDLPRRPQLQLAPAEAAYRAALSAPDLPRQQRLSAHVELADLLGRAGQPEKAALELTRALAIAPAQRRPELHLERGDAMRRTGRLSEAEKDFALAARLAEAPLASRASLELGWTLVRLGRQPEAVTAFEAALAGSRATRRAAIDQLVWRYLPLSVEEVTRRLDGDRPWHRRVLALVGTWHAELGRPVAAAELRRALFRRDPWAPTAFDDVDTAVALFDTAGRFEASAELVADAQRAYSERPKLAPRLDALLSRRGLALHRAARQQNSPLLYRKAAAAYAAYAGRRPGSAAAREQAPYRAECLYYAGRYRQAAEVYEQVYETTNDPEVARSTSYGVVRSLEAAVTAAIAARRLPRRADTRSENAALHHKRLELPGLARRWLEAVDVYVGSGDRAAVTVLLRRAAFLLARHGQRAEAIARLEELLRKAPDAAPIRTLLKQWEQWERRGP